MSSDLSQRDARRLAVRAQGLGAARPAPARPRAQAGALDAVMAQVGTIQLDAVNVLARTQFLVPWSRIGAYEPARLLELGAPGGRWFEYWGHAASLLPWDLHPLFRHRMERWRRNELVGAASRERRRAWREANAGYLEAVLNEVAQQGPLTAAQLPDPRRNQGTWWDRRSDGRHAMEMLFADGILAAWRSASFERVYDLADRVVPPEVRARPTPEPEEAERQLLEHAAARLGVGTAADLADYFWIRPAVARGRVAELVDDGRLVQVAVEGWGAPGYLPPGATPAPARRRRRAALLSPFDSLIWSRDRTERLFGFHFRIEIYVPEPLRRFGYYVLPLLVGEDLVGRFDLKADRKTRRLLVAGAYREPPADPEAVAAAAGGELQELAAWLGLTAIEVAQRGDLADGLRRALA